MIHLCFLVNFFLVVVGSRRCVLGSGCDVLYKPMNYAQLTLISNGLAGDVLGFKTYWACVVYQLKKKKCTKKNCCLDIWRIVLHCLMWCIWRERNARSIEGCERSNLEFKSFVFFSLLKWCLVLPYFSCFSLPALLDHCNLVS